MASLGEGSNQSWKPGHMVPSLGWRFAVEGGPSQPFWTGKPGGGRLDCLAWLAAHPESTATCVCGGS